MIQEEIKKIVDKAVKKLGNVNMPEVLVETPKEKTHGDYVTSVSFELAKVLKKNPNEIALLLKSQVEKNEIFKKVEVVGGFINFFIADEIFNENIGQILKEKDGFGKNDSLKNKKVIVEYTDPNPFKEFHIGHLMSNSIGESITRLLEFSEADVKRVCYQGDIGLHVAKTLYILTEQAERGVITQANVRLKDIGNAYVEGYRRYEENELDKVNINKLNAAIYKFFEDNRKDTSKNHSFIPTIAWYELAKDLCLQHFSELYHKLGTKFEKLFFESDTIIPAKEMIENGLKRGVFEKGDKGAIIFRGEKLGLHTRVFVNSEGLPTYEAKDLALPGLKYDYFKYDKSIIVTANEQNAYFDVMLAALNEIEPKLAVKTTHIEHGMMRFAEGKMSSRKGNVITGESLLEDLEKKAREIALNNESDNPFTLATQVAVAAIKYQILRQNTKKDIIFNPESALSINGDSGPYLQYSLVRAVSVLNKAKEEKIKPSLKNAPNEINVLVKMMHHFPEVIEKAGKELSPHYIATYITELAREFNNYYAHNKIVDRENEKLSAYNVAVTGAFAVIMKNGLWLLGISAPEKM